MALNLTAKPAQAHTLTADIIVLGVFATASSSKSATSKASATKKKAPTNATLTAVDKALGKALSKQIAKDEFTGKKDQTLSLSTLGRVRAPRLVLIGLGDAGAVTDGDLRTFAARAARMANVERATSLTLGLPEGLESRLRPVAEGLELGAYRFTKYLTGDRRPKATLEKVTVATAAKLTPADRAQFEMGQKVGSAVNLT